MFGLNMGGCAVWAIDSYAEAVRFFESCPTGRGKTIFDARKIRGKEGSKVMDVRPLGEQIAFRYHSTDVVTWHPDNSYTVDLTYDSGATCIFANRFTPSGHYSDGQGRRHVVGDWAYPGVGWLTVTAEGEVSPYERRFTRSFVDRAKAKRVLEEAGFPAYDAWHKAMWPMVKDNLPPIWKRHRVHTNDILVYLREPELWHDLMVSALSHKEIRSTLLSLGNAYKQVIEERVSAKSTTLNKWSVT